MLRGTSLLRNRALARSYATPASPHALVYLEHRQGTLDSASLSALTAASQLGGAVTGLIIGSPEEVSSVVDKAKRLKGLNALLHCASPQYCPALPETVSPLFERLLTWNDNDSDLDNDWPRFTHVVSAHSSAAKSLLPRVAAKLDVPAVSDIISLAHDAPSGSTTFTRPIYAGNAISTVRASSSVPIKFFTVRSTAFPAAATAVPQDGAGDDNALAPAAVKVKSIDPVPVPHPPTEHITTSLTKSDRPDLGIASRVVSGGRALKNAQTFQSIMYPLADALGAAVGASRAAVDAGYADNSLQVGQTGKVVAPEMYMALGISGAIQHLAGMKDSKLIVAINKDADAPIFQVADVGLVADIFEAVPEIIEKLKQ